MRQLVRRVALFLVGVRFHQRERKVGELRVVEIDIKLPRWMGPGANKRVARRMKDDQTEADAIGASALRIRREGR